MKNIIYILVICLTFAFISCDEDTQDVSIVTHFVILTMDGDETILLPLGTNYVDPGVTAMEGEEDVTSSLKIIGAVNKDQVGLYDLEYKATNKDGFSSSLFRTVIVYDPNVTTDISGTYTTADGSYRYWVETGAIVNFSGYPIEVTYVVPGIFYMSDYFAGYYDQRAGYGPGYAMKGYFTLNADNSLTILSGDVSSWGNSYQSFENGKFDSTTNSLSWKLGYEGSMYFYNTITK